MLAQFQVCYPTGSLTSELLTIYQGKFVVRVSVQIEGVVRATGMAASESLELAEDQARNRALMVLGIGATISPQPESTVEQPVVQLDMQPVKIASSLQSTEQEIAPKSERVGELESLTPSSPVSPALSSWDQEPKDFTENFRISSVQTEISDNPLLSFSNVTPLVPRNYSSQDAGAMEQKDAETKVEVEPIDFSDAISRTSVELKRLGWNNQKGREYLKRTYNKQSRPELTDEEMLEFLHYLESQPSPNRPS